MTLIWWMGELSGRPAPPCPVEPYALLQLPGGAFGRSSEQIWSSIQRSEKAEVQSPYILVGPCPSNFINDHVKSQKTIFTNRKGSNLSIHQGLSCEHLISPLRCRALGLDPATCALLRQSLLGQLAHQSSSTACRAARFILQTAVPTADPGDTLSAALPLLEHLLLEAPRVTLSPEQLSLTVDLLPVITPAALLAAAAGAQAHHRAAGAAESLLAAAQVAPLVAGAGGIRRGALALVTPLLFESLSRHQRSEMFLVRLVHCIGFQLLVLGATHISVQVAQQATVPRDAPIAGVSPTPTLYFRCPEVDVHLTVTMQHLSPLKYLETI